jgi:hypothetical protein
MLYRIFAAFIAAALLANFLCVAIRNKNVTCKGDQSPSQVAMVEPTQCMDPETTRKPWPGTSMVPKKDST